LGGFVNLYVSKGIVPEYMGNVDESVTEFGERVA
jgi:hypothetical protein